MHLDFDMGRYGPYVWGAWGASVLVLMVLTLWTRARARLAHRRLEEIEREGEP